MEAPGLREGILHERLRVTLLAFENDHGCRGLFVKTGDGADPLAGMDDVLSDAEHAASN